MIADNSCCVNVLRRAIPYLFDSYDTVIYNGGRTLANHKSAAKRARQASKRQTRNASVTSAVKTFEKKVLKAIENKSAKDASLALSEFTSKMMAAVTKGVIKKTTASRKVGRLSTRVSTLSK